MRRRRSGLIMLILAAVTLVGGYCYADTLALLGPAPSVEMGVPSDLTVADVYQRAEETLRRSGQVYHATIQVDADLGIVSYRGTTRQWIDAGRKVAREDADLGRLGGQTSLLTAEARYVRQQNGRFTVTPARTWTCHGASVAASAVLGCPGPTERSTTEVRQGSYGGRPALILVTTGASSGSDETFTFTKRLYLDPNTALPRALDSAGQVDFGQVKPTRERRTYRHELLPANAVPADFFAPASMGYVPTDPEEALNRPSPDLTVFWLGREFAGAGELPGLILANVTVSGSGRGPGYRFLLHYARADDPFGPPVVTLQVWPRAAWNTFLGGSNGKGGQMWDDPCGVGEEVVLPEGKATVYSGFTSNVARVPGGQPPSAKECPTRPYDTFLAHAYLGQTVVVANAPSVSGPGGAMKSPYDTREGMKAIVRSLRPRQP